MSLALEELQREWSRRQEVGAAETARVDKELQDLRREWIDFSQTISSEASRTRDELQREWSWRQEETARVDKEFQDLRREWIGFSQTLSSEASRTREELRHRQGILETLSTTLRMVEGKVEDIRGAQCEALEHVIVDKLQGSGVILDSLEQRLVGKFQESLYGPAGALGTVIEEIKQSFRSEMKAELDVRVSRSEVRADLADFDAIARSAVEAVLSDKGVWHSDPPSSPRRAWGVPLLPRTRGAPLFGPVAEFSCNLGGRFCHPTTGGARTQPKHRRSAFAGARGGHPVGARSGVCHQRRQHAPARPCADRDAGGRLPPAHRSPPVRGGRARQLTGSDPATVLDARSAVCHQWWQHAPARHLDVPYADRDAGTVDWQRRRTLAAAQCRRHADALQTTEPTRSPAHAKSFRCAVAAGHVYRRRYIVHRSRGRAGSSAFATWQRHVPPIWTRQRCNHQIAFGEPATTLLKGR
eukprot:NODE_1233_length_2552_cov_11.368660.p1 GENE.NODE_1233_length_2552_cov_11.368660~~NODE_1233_length_2552_cov_11.368660.p1  ORF type:complete len:470 (-),score=70.88 NODE_1233_length_2552_cov_11.368660:991-2400(-)